MRPVVQSARVNPASDVSQAVGGDAVTARYRSTVCQGARVTLPGNALAATATATAVLLLSFAAQSVWSQGVATPAGVPDAAWAQRIEDFYRRSREASAVGDVGACKALVQEARADLHSGWSPAAFRLWSDLSSCDLRPGGLWYRTAPPVEDLRAALAALIEHYEAMPRDLRLQGDLTTAARYHRVALLRELRHDEEADREEERLLQELLARAAADPPDALAVAGLEMIGGMLYGARVRSDWLEQLQARAAAALGPGHAVTLRLLRARIFAMRLLARPVQALALSDEFARRVQQRQGGDEQLRERLMMGNRSERVGALAALGRFADARDEGLLLQAWMERQHPRPHANLMRSAYNLAGLHLAMADYDGAEAFALRSIEEGLQAPTLRERLELALPRQQLRQAQVLRGDADSVAALLAELHALPHLSINEMPSLVTALRAPPAAGTLAERDWVLARIRELARVNTAALDPLRGLPAVLQAEAQPPGSTDGVAAALEGAVYALAGEDRAARVQSQFALARHLAERQPEAAVWISKRAAGELLALRGGLPDEAGPAARAMLTGWELPLRRFTGLLVDQGRLAEAEQALELLREEELHGFRRRSRGASMWPLAPAHTHQALSLTAPERRREQGLLALQAPLRDAAQAAQQRLDSLRRWIDWADTPDPAAQAALAQGVSSLQSLTLLPVPAGAGAVAARRPGVEGGAPPAALSPGHARLTYVLRADGVDLLLQRGRQRLHVHVVVEPARLNRAVLALRQALQQPSSPTAGAVPPPARELYRWLIEPVAGALRGVAHLHLRPDAALRWLPFAALHDGRGWLAERHVLSIGLGVGAVVAGRLPGVAGTRGDPPRPGRVTAFGRTQPDERHAALPGVAAELAALRDVAPLLRAEVALDAAFTEAALTQALARRPALLHLASHFVLDPAGEEASYLLLGDGTRLPLRRLRELPWAGVHLALLSACDSAVPLQADVVGEVNGEVKGEVKGDVKGDVKGGREWTGFAAALHAAGVPNVLATLWRIDDAAAARWMRHFYAGLGRGRPGTAPVRLGPQVLALAQRGWLKQHRGTDLAHPYHWAAFQWMTERP